jgi:transposase-like protein
MRWVQRYVPYFVKQWRRLSRPVGKSWRIDETSIKCKGHWVYLDRGVDKEGQTIDCFLSERRDVTAAKRFLQLAIEKRGVPQQITLAGDAASPVAVGELQEEGMLPAKFLVWGNRHLNNVIEQDHRRIKKRVRPMLGFKRLAHASITIAGIELVHQIKKKQFDVSALCSPQTRTPHVWETVLAA